MTALDAIITRDDILLVAAALVCVGGPAILLGWAWCACKLAKKADALTAAAWREVAEKRQV